MHTPNKRWLSVAILACCLAVFLSHFEGIAARIAPEFPGKDASVDELVQFYNEVQQYLNSASRPRYGKRSSSQTRCGDPYASLDCYT